jgi:hypothetical protein
MSPVVVAHGRFMREARTVTELVPQRHLPLRHHAEELGIAGRFGDP